MRYALAFHAVTNIIEKINPLYHNHIHPHTQIHERKISDSTTSKLGPTNNEHNIYLLKNEKMIINDAFSITYHPFLCRKKTLVTLPSRNIISMFLISHHV